MAAQFEGKVVLITGAARGQGREHAMRFADQGADIIAVDLCDQIRSVTYPMARPEDLDETVRMIEKTGRRIVAARADVRDLEKMRNVVADAVAELGRIDFVIANAGIAPLFGTPAHETSAYVDAIDVLLNGVQYTVEAALPELLRHGDGGAIVLTSSVVAFRSASPTWGSHSQGAVGYTAAKAGVTGLMRYYATVLGEKGIRVNSVHPTVVATPMAENAETQRQFAEHPDWAAYTRNPLGIPLIEPADVTAAVVYLCGESGRYVTGVTLPVDAGTLLV
jgi:SDR family mycofactocin-dependent oxidoreductase